MLQVARLAPNLLQEAADPVAEFLLSQFNDDGGAKDRAGMSDLYYTVFGLEGLVALQRDLPARAPVFLESFGEGESLDIVHLCCLARCWATLGKPGPDLSGRIESLWERDSVYHSFLAYGALQDLGKDPESFPVTADLQTTPTTAAAITLQRNLHQPVSEESVKWLLGCAHPEGGFRATPDASVPDLLSTATALHALSGQKESFAHLKDKTLDFLDTLWTGKAFCGNWTDDEQDCEYTYYALLAMGHLSLA